MSKRLNDNAGEILYRIVTGIPGSPSQREIAGEMGISESAVSYHVKKLERDKYITKAGRSIELAPQSRDCLLQEPDLARALLYLYADVAEGGGALPAPQTTITALSRHLGLESERAARIPDELLRMDYLMKDYAGRLKLNVRKVVAEMSYLEHWL